MKLKIESYLCEKDTAVLILSKVFIYLKKKPHNERR